MSATEGDNVVTRSHRTPWYDGPTVLGYLESVDDTRLAVGSEFRFPVQHVRAAAVRGPAPWAARAPEVDGDYRGYAGKIESGRVRLGDEIVVLPRGSHRGRGDRHPGRSARPRRRRAVGGDPAGHRHRRVAR